MALIVASSEPPVSVLTRARNGMSGIIGTRKPMPIQAGSSIDQAGTRSPHGWARARPSRIASPDIATVRALMAAQFRWLHAPSRRPPPRSPAIVQKIFMTRYGAIATAAPYPPTRPTPAAVTMRHIVGDRTCEVAERQSVRRWPSATCHVRVQPTAVAKRASCVTTSSVPPNSANARSTTSSASKSR